MPMNSSEVLEKWRSSSHVPEPPLLTVSAWPPQLELLASGTPSIRSQCAPFGWGVGP